MKKSLIIFVLLSLSGALFARGGQETNADQNDTIQKIEDGSLSIQQIEIKDQSGLLYVTLDKISDQDILFSKGIVLVRKADLTSYYSTDMTGVTPSETEALLQAAIPGSPHTFQALMDQESLQDVLLSAEYQTLSISPQVLSQMEDVSQTIHVPVPLGNAVLSILLSDASGNGLVLNLNTSVNDVFAQETAILSELFPDEEEADKQRALLLGAYIYSKDGSSEDFTSYVNLFSLDSAAITGLFPASDEQMREPLQNGLDRLKVYLAGNFKNNYEDDESFTSPYLHFSQADFLSLYQKEGSAYIRDYMQFLFALGKPLFSSFYAGENNSFEEGIYNFRDYRPVSEDEGKTLALNAMRYLNWGVEYTLPERVGSIKTSSSDKKVFSTLLEEGSQDAENAPWFQGEDGDPSVNYLASSGEVKSIKDSPVQETQTSDSLHTFEISQLNGDKEITLAGRTDGAEITLQNLEVWTALNLMADPAARSSVISSTGEDLSKLYDGKSDSSVSFNGNEKVITVTFSSPRDIGGIVMKGTFPSGKNIHFTVGDSDETQSWRRSSSGNFSWKRLDEISTPIEVGTDSSHYYYRYLQNKSDLQGVSQIQLKISSAQAINFSLDELMIFEGDPLRYVDYDENQVLINSYEHLFASADKSFQNLIKTVLYNTSSTTLKVSSSKIISFVQGEEVTNYILNLSDSSGIHQFHSNGKVYRPNRVAEEASVEQTFFLDLPLQHIVKKSGSYKNLTLTFQTGAGQIQNPALLDSSSILQKSLYLVSSYSGESLQPGGLADSPFLVGTDGQRGNPLPYTPLGADSPRTFAYKMAGQASSDPLTTLAADEANGGWENYRNYNAGSESYRPGLISSSAAGYDNNQYSPKRSAGVDSMGFLTGVAAMSEIPLFGTDGRIPTASLDKFYRELDLEGFDYQGNHRLTPADLELASLLVPQAEMARQGDILINYDEYGNIQDIAFIVEMPDTSSSDKATDFWTGVKVVSVKRVFKRASLGVWGLSADVKANGFTQEPSRYQIRRLLTGESTSTEGGTVQWEAVDNLPANLDYTITFDTNDGNVTPPRLRDENGNLTDLFLEWGEHFIPNTTEPLHLKSLEFTLTDSAGLNLSYFQETGQKIPVEVAPPKDPYYDSAKNDSGNVYNNTGDGIDFGYVKEGSPSIQRLVTMTRTAPGTYTVTKDPAASGELYLQYDTEEKKYILKYEYEEGDALKLTQDFYVSTLRPSDGVSRPGDDFLLNFRLADYPDVKTDKENEDINFLAVYDKKMLWRANLYIAEEKDDWNDLHPWIDGNEWNRVLSEGDYDDFAEDKLISTLAVGNGDQVIKIPDYSPLRTGSSNEGRVSYDYPEGNFYGTDSPFDYVYKLLRQRENINDYYSTGGQPDPVSLIAGDPIALSALQNWEKTQAPSDKWINYRREPSGSYQAFLPGVGLYKEHPDHDNLSTNLKNNYSTVVTPNTSILSAGVDCVGFAQRSASYNSQRDYRWGTVEENITEGGIDSRSSTFGYPYLESSNKYSVKISYYKQNDNYEYENLDLIRPGDIVFYGSGSSWDGKSNGAHIFIVNKVKRSEDSS